MMIQIHYLTASNGYMTVFRSYWSQHSVGYNTCLFTLCRLVIRWLAVTLLTTHACNRYTITNRITIPRALIKHEIFICCPGHRSTRGTGTVIYIYIGMYTHCIRWSIIANVRNALTTATVEFWFHHRNISIMLEARKPPLFVWIFLISWITLGFSQKVSIYFLIQVIGRIL